MRRAFALVACAVVAAAGCAGNPQEGRPARVEVEVLRGFSPQEVAVPETNAPVVLIVDSTQSMAGRASPGSSRHAAAERAAVRFAQRAPQGRPLWLYAMGARTGSSCRKASLRSRALGDAQRGRLVRELQGLGPRGEGSLAASLEGVREDLAKAGSLTGSRVVVFSALRSACRENVCRAAGELVRAGARIDVVAIGDADVPACLSEPSRLVQGEPPPPFVPEPVHYRLEVSRPEPMTVGCSHAGGLPVAISGGRATVVVDLDPPLRVDAYFAPGRRHVLQIVDFPMLDPPARQWRWLDAGTVPTGTSR